MTIKPDHWIEKMACEHKMIEPVVDADTGAYIPITEFVHRKKTLSLNTHWQLEPAKVSHFIPQGIKPVYELKTYTGLKIKATANHPFRLLNKWIPLKDIQIGDRIAVARHL